MDSKPRRRFKQKMSDETVARPPPADEDISGGEQLQQESEAAEAEAPTCASCGQQAGSFDRDCLPQKKVVLKWLKGNVSSKTGQWRPSGRECYHCDKEMVKSVKNPREMLLAFARDAEMKDNFSSRRRCRARGETRYQRKPKEGSSVVKDTKEEYDDNFDEGFCYLIDDYLQLMKCEERDRMTRSEKARWIETHCGKKIFKDKKGQFVVKESNLPHAACYKYKAGSRDSTSFQEVTCFSDSEDAAEAFDEYVAEDVHRVKRHRSARSMSPDARPNLPPQRRHVAAAASQLLSPPQRSPRSRSLSRRAVGTLRQCNRSRSRGSRSCRDNRSHSIRRSAVSQASAAAPQTEAAEASPREKSIDRSTLGMAPQASPAAGAVVADDDDQSRKKVSKVTLVQLKTTKVAKLLELSELLLQDAKSISDDDMYDGSWKSRDFSQLQCRLETASNRCSGIVEDTLRDKGIALADQLLMESEELKIRSEFLTEARERPKAALLKTCSLRQLGIFEKMASSLAQRVFTGIASAAILRVTPEEPNALRECLSFLEARPPHGSSQQQRLTLFFMGGGAEARKTVQVNAVANLIDHMFATFKEQAFAKAWAEVSGILPISRGNHYFSPGVTAMTDPAASASWAPQCLIDLSLVLVIVQALENEVGSTQRRRISLSTMWYPAVLPRSKMCLFDCGLSAGPSAWRETLVVPYGNTWRCTQRRAITLPMLRRRSSRNGEIQLMIWRFQMMMMLTPGCSGMMAES